MTVGAIVQSRRAPPIASTRCAGTLARWFGVSGEALPTVARSIDTFSVSDLGAVA